MMRIELCKWYNGAASPVLFMIDDLANAWVDTNSNGKVEWGEDWGFFRNEDQSSFRFLEERILREYPDVKVTFFVPVGCRVGMVIEPQLTMVSEPINATEDSRAFFRFIHHHPNYELAYHGTTHGVPGRLAADFRQEWASFGSLDEALQRIGEGLHIFEDAAGARPLGGKYCGYTSNEFSDESINSSGFTWWCRYWNRGLESGISDPTFGTDPDPLTNYDIKRFGSRGVIDIPSTVNGALLNGAFGSVRSPKGAVKRMLRKTYIRQKLRSVDALMEHQLVISIQEHIAPSRDDGKRQSPNIFDDSASLIQLFSYLKGKNVWYCTGSELADYVNTRDHSVIEHMADGRFKLRHEMEHRGRTLSLRSRDLPSFRLRLPDGTSVQAVNGVVNIPVLPGEYTVMTPLGEESPERGRASEGAVPDKIQSVHPKRRGHRPNRQDQRVY
ncbi:hypothetical protein [Paenibacillus cineris]|nr:hypothetical protein [Paenibacillus cineris]